MPTSLDNLHPTAQLAAIMATKLPEKELFHFLACFAAVMITRGWDSEDLLDMFTEVVRSGVKRVTA